VAVDEMFLAKIVFEPGVASIKGNKSSQHTQKLILVFTPFASIIAILGNNIKKYHILNMWFLFKL